MESPKISIITRTRNRPLLLARAVQSVTGQDNPPPWEWIIVNDAGDPDPVQKVLAPAINRFPGQIHLINLDESHGMEHASNTGIRKACGEFLVIHDDDDSWDPAFLRKMIVWLEQPGNAGFAGVVCHSIRVVEEIGDAGIRVLHEEPFNNHLESISPWLLLQQNAYPPISFVFRREIYDAVGPFDESLPVLGDWEFNIRVILRSPIGLFPEALARYHHRTRSVTGEMANSINTAHSGHLEWEKKLRKRWLETPPGSDIPVFGSLSRIAAAVHANRDGLSELLSLPLRPGPQV